MSNPVPFTKRPFLFGILLLVVGAALVWGGVTLILLNGSPYYVLAGLATLASGALVLAGRREGASVYWAMTAASTVWAFWEVGADAWGLAPRLIAPIVLGLWFIMPWTWRSLRGRPAVTLPKAIGIGAGVLVVCASAGGGLHSALVSPSIDPLF